MAQVQHCWQCNVRIDTRLHRHGLCCQCHNAKHDETFECYACRCQHMTETEVMVYFYGHDKNMSTVSA